MRWWWIGRSFLPDRRRSAFGAHRSAPPAGELPPHGGRGTAPPRSHCRCKGCGVLLHLRRNAGSAGAGGGGALLVQPPAGLCPAGADRRALSARRLSREPSGGTCRGKACQGVYPQLYRGWWQDAGRMRGDEYIFRSPFFLMGIRTGEAVIQTEEAPGTV